MKTAHILQLLGIVVLFVALLFLIGWSSNYTRVTRNWEKYRCDVGIMPFASMYGYDTNENFSYCMKNMQSSQMGDLLKPVYDEIGEIGKMSAEIEQNQEETANKVDDAKSDMKVTFSGIGSQFDGIKFAIRRTSDNMKDVFGKIVGTFTVLLYILDGGQKTVKSMWNGVPGKLIKTVGKLSRL